MTQQDPTPAAAGLEPPSGPAAETPILTLQLVKPSDVQDGERRRWLPDREDAAQRVVEAMSRHLSELGHYATSDEHLRLDPQPRWARFAVVARPVPPANSVAATLLFNERILESVLDSAFRTGSTYWIQEVIITKDITDLVSYADIILAGGELDVLDNEDYKGERRRVNRETLALGLVDLSRDRDEAHQIGRLLGDGLDADMYTGDALLQCIVFGRTVFG